MVTATKIITVITILDFSVCLGVFFVSVFCLLVSKRECEICVSRECKCPVISELQPLTLNENSAFDNLGYVANFLKSLIWPHFRN